MDHVRFENFIHKPIGLWKGFDWVPPSGWKTTKLDDLLLATKEQVPNFERVPTVQRLRREALNGLLKLRLNQSQIRELLAFEGKFPDLVLILNDLDSRFGTDFPFKLRKTLIELRSARVRSLLEFFKSGALGFTPQLAFDSQNKVMNAYLDAIQARMQGSQTSDQTLEVKFCEVGAGYAAPGDADPSLFHIIGSGKAPGEIDVMGYQTTWITHFELNENNGATTTIAAVNSPTEIELTSAAGFAIGDQIEIQTSAGPAKRTIIGLVDNTVTLNAPVAGMAVTNPVIQIWGESGLKGNAAGTTLLSHNQFSDEGYTKTLHKSILVESAVIERGVGA